MFIIRYGSKPQLIVSRELLVSVGPKVIQSEGAQKGDGSPRGDALLLLNPQSHTPQSTLFLYKIVCHSGTEQIFTSIFCKSQIKELENGLFACPISTSLREGIGLYFTFMLMEPSCPVESYWTVSQASFTVCVSRCSCVIRR